MLGGESRGGKESHLGSGSVSESVRVKSQLADSPHRHREEVEVNQPKVKHTHPFLTFSIHPHFSIPLSQHLLVPSATCHFRWSEHPDISACTEHLVWAQHPLRLRGSQEKLKPHLRSLHLDKPEAVLGDSWSL